MPRRWTLLALAAVAIALAGGRIIAGAYADYHWYAAMGATSLWRAMAWNTLLVRGISAIAGSLFVLLNLYVVNGSVLSVALPRRVANLDIGAEVPMHYRLAGVGALSVALGLLLTLPQQSWTTIALARYGTLFRESDPYFQLDVGFYVFWLPFETSLYIWSLIAVLLVIAVVVFLYVLTSSLRWQQGRLTISSYARRHLALLGALLVLVLAWSYRLDAYGTLIDGSGRGGAFTFLDHKVTIYANLVLATFAGAAALVVAWSGWSGQIRVALATVAAVILTSLLLRQALPAALARLAEPAAAISRERPYEATRASYTRRAFALDRVVTSDSVEGFASLAQAALGVPLWDAVPLARSAERVRRGPAVDGLVSWRRAADAIVADVVERPAEQGSDARQANGWTAVRLDATDADERGGVVTADPARGSLAEESGVRLAALVFDSAGEYIVVADSSHSLPAAPLDGFGSRLAHAWSQQNFRILFGDLPAPDPRIVLRRDVRERIDALAPFFVQGDQVAPLVMADTLYWVVHLYSASSTYPLSQHLAAAGATWSYFQHAATAVVNAGTGRVALVADPVLDPIASTWIRRFPELFTTWARLPAALPAALPPPADGASAQAAAFAGAGPRGGPVPQLQLAPASAQSPDSGTSTGPLAPLALPSRSAELALTLPLLESGNRLRGALIAYGGADRRTVWLAEARDQSRWSAALDRFTRVGDSLAASLPRDARVLHGTVRVVPVAGRLVLVAPYYNWRLGGPPLAVAVAVLDGDSLHVARTVPLALASGIGIPSASESPASFRARIDGLYDAMRAALRAGDWAAFGRAYDALGVALGKSPR